MDGITELSCKNGITQYGVDAWEATHNRSVAGSRPASPTDAADWPEAVPVAAAGGPCGRSHSDARVGCMV
jgi:hypothetical protein